MPVSYAYIKSHARIEADDFLFIRGDIKKGAIVYAPYGLHCEGKVEDGVILRLHPGHLQAVKIMGSSNIDCSQLTPDQLQIQIAKLRKQQGVYNTQGEFVPLAKFNGITIEKTVGDDVEISGVGNINLTTVGDRLRIKLTIGNVTIQQVGQHASIYTREGDLRIERAHTHARFSTKKGDIYINHFDKPIHLKTPKGKVFLSTNEISPVTTSASLESLPLPMPAISDQRVKNYSAELITDSPIFKPSQREIPSFGLGNIAANEKVKISTPAFLNIFGDIGSGAEIYAPFGLVCHGNVGDNVTIWLCNGTINHVVTPEGTNTMVQLAGWEAFPIEKYRGVLIRGNVGTQLKIRGIGPVTLEQAAGENLRVNLRYGHITALAVGEYSMLKTAEGSIKIYRTTAYTHLVTHNDNIYVTEAHATTKFSLLGLRDGQIFVNDKPLKLERAFPDPVVCPIPNTLGQVSTFYFYQSSHYAKLCKTHPTASLGTGELKSPPISESSQPTPPLLLSRGPKPPSSIASAELPKPPASTLPRTPKAEVSPSIPAPSPSKDVKKAKSQGCRVQ